ncbi:J domain-containing protein [Nafulsella turpanensis]|uniref:J domain-containing protein n=1 Tax=Nafulsella turpanensis TaxID=1265690 RepID=UPI000347DCC8|nr:J domain-containing protein [Nafulsella turpanensis]
MGLAIESYYQALGLTKNASLAEIKQAYRRMAKQLHPDKNASPEAHDQFIFLTEAYEFLINVETGNAEGREPAASFEEWHESYQEQARERARQYARMQYEEFKRTDYYKKSQAALTVWNHLYFFSSLFFLLSPLWGFLFKGWAGFFGGLFATFITVHYWAGVFREKSKVNFRSFFHSAGIIVRTKTFLYITAAIANLVLFFLFTLNTQLTVWGIGAGLLAIYALFFLFLEFRAIHLTPVLRNTISICWIPTIFNLFFLINFSFSSNPVVEKYPFVHKEVWYDGSFSKGRWEKIASIYLPGEQYSEYSWFTVFFDFEAMEHKREITYTFEEGLLGLRVLKKYEFTK